MKLRNEWNYTSTPTPTRTGLGVGIDSVASLYRQNVWRIESKERLSQNLLLRHTARHL